MAEIHNIKAAFMPTIDIDQLFLPNTDSVLITPDGSEELYYQVVGANYKMKTKAIGDLGGNLSVSGTDQTVGTLINKHYSLSPIEVSVINQGGAEQFSINRRIFLAPGTDLDNVASEGIYLLDTATNTVALSAYANMPGKLSLVESSINMDDVVITVLKPDASHTYQRLNLIYNNPNNTIVTLEYIRVKLGGTWMEWVENTAHLSYTTSEKDIDNLLFDGVYSLLFDGLAGDHTDFNNLPSDLPYGIDTLADLFANLPDSYIQVTTPVRKAAVSLIQKLNLIYNSGADKSVYVYTRFLKGSTWSPWHLCSCGIAQFAEWLSGNGIWASDQEAYDNGVPYGHVYELADPNTVGETYGTLRVVRNINQPVEVASVWGDSEGQVVWGDSEGDVAWGG